MPFCLTWAKDVDERRGARSRTKTEIIKHQIFNSATKIELRVEQKN
jgi:hypothetical protein